MIARKHHKSIIKILIFGLVLAIFGFIYGFIERSLLGPLTEYPATGNPYNFSHTITIITAGSFFLGLVFGIFEIFLLNKTLRNGTFGRKLFFKISFYIIAINLFLIIGSWIASCVTMELPPWHSEVLTTLSLFIGNFTYWALLLYAGGIIFGLLFFIEISDYLGQQVVMNFLMGWYHEPQEEVRIFMFLDMRSSTTIAEKLGHERYFDLLKTYYSTMTDAIAEVFGEVYQYVGDEIIVSWNLKNGIRDNNFLNCFFNIEEAFELKSERFKTVFGLVPTFKAGFHFGKVTTGEIGELKKEVLFTGDVLNTTSRIQNLCNHYQVNLLISTELLSMIELPENFDEQDIGVCELRGKDAKVKLSTVTLSKD